MKIATISRLKASLSEYLAAVRAGEELIVTDRGKPVAKIVRYEPAGSHRRLGLFAGQIEISADFDEWPEDIARKLGIID